jgi:hypothetical protein
MRPINLAISLCVLFLGSSTLGCGAPAKSETQITVLSAKALESRAIEESKKWRADAYLTEARISAPTLDPPPPLAYPPIVNFSFRSRNDPSHIYVVDFVDGRTDLREWTVSLSESDYVSIESADWAIDSGDAWRIAWANGAKDFALKYPTATQDALLKLARWDPPRSGPVWWYVAFVDYRQQHSLFIFIDAKTGEVVRKKED